HRRDRREGQWRAATPGWRGDRQRARGRRDCRGGAWGPQRRGGVGGAGAPGGAPPRSRGRGGGAPRGGGGGAGGGGRAPRGEGAAGLAAGANTTIGVVVTDAELTKEQANRVAVVAHDGIARAVRPAHTR